MVDENCRYHSASLVINGKAFPIESVHVHFSNLLEGGIWVGEVVGYVTTHEQVVKAVIHYGYGLVAVDIKELLVLKPQGERPCKPEDLP